MASSDEHIEISRKLLRDSEEELIQGETLQASEKAWGAAAHAVKAAAENRGWSHRSHRDLFRVVRWLAVEYEDLRVRGWFGRANTLHINFYENTLSSTEIGSRIADVRSLIEMLHEPAG